MQNFPYCLLYATVRAETLESWLHRFPCYLKFRKLNSDIRICREYFVSLTCHFVQVRSTIIKFFFSFKYVHNFFLS